MCVWGVGGGATNKPESWTNILVIEQINIRITYFFVATPTHLVIHLPGQRVRSKKRLAFVLV